MSSVFDTGNVEENAVRGGLRYAVDVEAGGGPCPRSCEGRLGGSRGAAEGYRCVPLGFLVGLARPAVGMRVRIFGISEPGMGDGKEGVAGGPGDIEPASAIVSRESEKVEVDGLGVDRKDEGEGGGRRSCNCNWPSMIEFLRAWGWLGGREGDLARGAIIRADDGPDTGAA